MANATLTFGLVSTDVKLKKIEEKSATGFKLASPDGNPAKQVYLDEATGEVIGTRADCKSGLFTENGFVEIPKETQKQIDEETALESMNIDGFIPLDEAPFERTVSAYYIAPGGKGGIASVKPLALLRDGLHQRQVAGYGRVTLTTKTYPFLVFEKDGGLFVTLLIYADEFKRASTAAEVLASVSETDEKTLQLAGSLFDQIGGSRAALDALVDDRRDKREELVALALAGEVIPTTEKPEAAEATAFDLADLLAKSIGEAAAKKDAVAA